ncbi:hypothetical protein C6P40_001054 [Pichia californica]|uniref:Uncharacterized protein n=1 Tax=Pichia californica TaxID=460514 RepID=A0A9P7BG62_9ASCO|nr:hypothetical protein C6P42_002271 [[Candida] californica]KAG0688369.1 hypothetical protein C6P40_001054 [[Candida] californica]
MGSQLLAKSTNMISLDEIILKLSMLDMNVDVDGEDNELFESENSFFNSIKHYLSVTLESYDPVVNERIKQMLFIKDENTREEYKLELITIFSIIKSIEYIEALLTSTVNIDSARKANTLLTSFFGLFKYHFQLPVYHNNYAFKNFGVLLTSPKINIIAPFIKFMSCSNSATFNELNKSENLEKTFSLLLVFHCFNQDLFKFLIEFLSNKSNVQDIIFHFNLKVNNNKTTISIPSICTIFQRFKILALLEESTLTIDSKSTNLMNIIFYSLFNKQFLVEILMNITEFASYFNNLESLSENLSSISNKLFLSPTSIDFLTIFIVNDIKNFKMLDNFIKLESSSNKEKDMSGFLLLKASQNHSMNYNLFVAPDSELLSYLIEYNNANSSSILGISDDINVSELNITTLIPLFEIINQNLKLNYLNERNLLTVFKLSLINLDLNLDSIEDFMNLNSLLIDIGCSLGIHALIDTIQTLLCIIINKIKFNHPIFNQLPSDYEKCLSFDKIPPVHRSDMSFENSIDLQAENFGTIYQSLQEMENHSSVIETNSKILLEDSLILILSVKTKIFRFLKTLNNETNVLRLPDLFSEENKPDEYPLHVFRQGISTKIGSFKSSRSLNYKLLNSSITLGLIANLSLLVISENYKSLKTNTGIVDNSLSRLLNEFSIDFSLTFLIIYQEFGLLSFFKRIRDLNNENLKMILPSASLLSKLFQVKNAEVSHTNNSSPSPNTTSTPINSNFQLLSEILYKSVISSNLLRQYVELFDDGQSKPFKSLNKFLKIHPSTLKPSKISKGSTTLNLNDYKAVLAFH